MRLTARTFLLKLRKSRKRIFAEIVRKSRKSVAPDANVSFTVPLNVKKPIGLVIESRASDFKLFEKILIFIDGIEFFLFSTQF